MADFTKPVTVQFPELPEHARVTEVSETTVLREQILANAKAFRFDIVNPADFDTVVDIDEKQGWAVFVTVKSQTAQGNRPEIAMCGMRKRKLHAAYLDLLRGLAVNMNNHRAKYLVGKQESKWKVEPTDFSELRAGSPTRG